MAKVLKNDVCAECMESLALVKGGPLTRIACANCQQAKQDLPGKARSGHGSQLRAALRALHRVAVVVMPDTAAACAGFTCPECGKTCATKGALGSHRRAHSTGREPTQQERAKLRFFGSFF